MRYTKSVIPAGIAGIQSTGMYLSSPSMALDTCFPAGMTSVRKRHGLNFPYYDRSGVIIQYQQTLRFVD